MLNLASTSDLVRVITDAASDIEVYAAWVDLASGVATPGRTNTASITTATTTTVVGSPAASTARNVKHLNIANNHVSVSCTVTVDHTDGTNPVELISVILLPGENLIFSEEGRWTHRDWNGAEYPQAGKGAYNGVSIPFMKTTTASDAAGYWYGSWKDGGFPGAWVPGTPGMAGRATNGTDSADFGCIPIANPATGANYLTSLELASSVNHTHIFFDLLWVQSGIAITTTTGQTVNSVALPARDINGTTNGEGCMIGLMVSAAAGLVAAGSNATVTYTNSAGTGSRTATLSAIAGSQAPATPVVGTIVWFNLQAKDKGVQSIQTITLGTSWVSGTINLFIARDICQLGSTIPNVSATKNIQQPGIRLYNNTCLLHAQLTSATTATFISGEIQVMEK